jgi:nucleotide-binding universal stress UspA family protein
MRVLVAIDQSDFGQQIIDAVKKRHWPAGSQFKIVSVIEPLPFQWEHLELQEWEKFAQEILDKRVAVTGGILAAARQHLLPSLPSSATVETEVRYGKAINEIVLAAAKWNANKLYIGAHGREPNRLLATGVPYSIPHRADCSVTLVRLHPLHLHERDATARAALHQPAEVAAK